MFGRAHQWNILAWIWLCWKIFKIIYLTQWFSKLKKFFLRNYWYGKIAPIQWLHFDVGTHANTTDIITTIKILTVLFTPKYFLVFILCFYLMVRTRNDVYLFCSILKRTVFFICSVVLQISKAYLVCITETLNLSSNNFPLPSACTATILLSASEFDCHGYLI